MIDKLSKYGPSIFSTMTGLALQHGALNLAQGFPDFPTDPKLITCVDLAMKDGYNQYSRPMGAVNLHKQIETLVFNNYGREVNGDEELTVYPGASFAIYLAMQALISAGDEVIIFEPAYECYAPAIEIVGGKVIPLQLESPNFDIDWHEVRKAFSSKTKMIVINNPHNPTAKVWSKEDLDALEELVLGTNCFILSDEVYEFINYTPTGHISIHSRAEMIERSIVVSSFGKSLHVTGWRIGYCIAPQNVTDLMRKVNQFSVFCTNHSIQMGVASYLENHFDPQILNSDYKAKRDFVKAGLKDSNWEVLDCEGTYFMMLDYSSISDLPSIEFTRKLVFEKGIATIPCSPFYSNGYDPKIVRICFAKKEETLQKAIDILCKI
ncbi:MAG: aminotransferase class I/II-fold pyridoxal phosphate-dependent enzyme [Saprospiraceae bacterium]|nr:aminotransferase class I/II-fold pyridoxal phosphate-dependent enzyme [Candidatus Brachybacter algidus]